MYIYTVNSKLLTLIYKLVQSEKRLSLEIVKVTPIEYSRKKIRRYYGYKIKDFKIEELYAYIKTKNFGAIPKIWQEEDMIFYQYPNQPLLIIKDDKLFTTIEVWKDRRFTQGKIRQQASILLRVLEGAGLATYNRKAIAKKRFTPTKYVPYSTRYYHATHRAKE
jgi:hypothetical protein